MALSAGISEALVNTASGILTSWFAVVIYNFFTNKIDKLTYALDDGEYTFDTDEVREALDGMPMNDITIMKYLREMIEENLKEIKYND